MTAVRDCAVAIAAQAVLRAPADRITACRDAGRRQGIAFPDVLVKERVVRADEAEALGRAAEYLLTGDHLTACSRCQVQAIGPSGARPVCPACGGSMRRGALWQAQRLLVDPGSGSELRRIVHDLRTRVQTEERVREASRMRGEGKLASRPEAELAPAAPPCTAPALGPYALESLVGRGSSSYVYRARDRRDGRVVALKLLWFHPDEDPARVQERLARLRREAELAGGLDHPHLVGTGPLEQDGGWHFLTMPLIEGPTLADVLQARARAGLEDVLPLLAALGDVARGLHFAHCRGVLHRDVNPRNILFDAAGVAYLVDFGAARPMASDSTLTRPQEILGTVGYVAPERLESESRAAVAGDVYSLGVVLHEILTGALPYPKEAPIRLLARMHRERPNPPSASLPGIPEALDRLVLQALDLDPGRRPASALDFAQQLADAVKSGEEPAERPTHAPEPIAASAPRRTPFLAFLAGALTTAAGFLLLVPEPASPGEANPAELEARIAALSRIAEAGESYAGRRAEAEWTLLRADHVSGISAADRRLLRARFAWSQGDFPGVLAALEGRRVGASPAESILDGLAGWFLDLRGEADGRWPAERRAAVLAEWEALRRTDAESVMGRYLAALESLISGDRIAAFDGFHRLARASGAPPEAAVLEVWTALREGAHPVAGALLDALESQRPTDPLVVYARAAVLEQAGDLDAALQAAGRLAERWPRMPEGPMLQGMALLQRGEPDRAAEALAEAIRRDPLLAAAHQLRATALRCADRACEAVAAASAAISCAPKRPGPLLARALALHAHGESEAAEAEMRRMLERFPEAPLAEEVRSILESR